MLFINENRFKKTISPITRLAHCGKMFKIIILIFSSLFVLVMPMGPGLQAGDGIWSLISISKCEVELPTVAIKVEIERTRINRTHDGITANLGIELLIDDSYGIFIEVCKFVDGGCKQYQIISDDSIINLIDKYAKENVIRAFELAKIDPPEFPVHEGEYDIVDFIVDYCEFPTNSAFGKFEAEIFLVNKEGERVACMKIIIEFSPLEDEEDLCV